MSTLIEHYNLEDWKREEYFDLLRLRGIMAMKNASRLAKQSS